jgi:acid phosphatase (class A)
LQGWKYRLLQGDVDAARIVASAVVARLHANDAFVKQLNKAKDEFSKLQKAGLIQSVSKK